jgi:8-oxo-dGTP pyrophosphatase MutT (NUDIX family)
MPGLWDIPGGTIEFGEKAQAALKREIYEETKLEVIPKNVIFSYDFMSNKNRHQFQLVYACDYVSGNVTLDPEEHDRFQWADFEQIDKLEKIAFLNELCLELKKN